MRRILCQLLALALCFTLVPTVTGQEEDIHSFTAVCSGKEEVPPRETTARATAIFHVVNDGTELAYTLIVANIRNVVAAHIHLGPAGVNGPVVAFLAGPFPAGGGRSDGVLAQGVIDAANLIGPLAGHPLSDLIAAMEAGNTYADVHTNDGVSPTNTGPGDFPGGEVRGQIFSGEAQN